MKIWNLLIREIIYRKTNFITGVLAVSLAATSFVGSVLLLRSHDWQTHQILEQKQVELEKRMAELNDDTRKNMLKLGFNIVILPKNQNLSDWYADDYASQYMPEAYVEKLANSGIITVRHFLPSLQQKIYWPEQKRKIILVGTRGEVPNLHKNPTKPMVQPVPQGTIILGHELHNSLGLRVGEKIKLMDQSFIVQKTHAERGNKDDITAWIHLREAQSLFKKQGLINAILALECMCAGNDALPRIRKEIADILPGTQVIERGSRALVRAETRYRIAQEAKASFAAEQVHRNNLKKVQERFASILTPIIILACAVWIAALGLINVRARREEIGILRALGVTMKRILTLFLSKYILIGFLGGLIGAVIGFSSVLLFNDHSVPFIRYIAMIELWIFSITGAIALAVLSAWIPALMAAQQDPADILRNE